MQWQLTCAEFQLAGLGAWLLEDLGKHRLLLAQLRNDLIYADVVSIFVCSAWSLCCVVHRCVLGRGFAVLLRHLSEWLERKRDVPRRLRPPSGLAWRRT